MNPDALRVISPGEIDRAEELLSRQLSGAEMFGIASDFEESCGTGLQQEMVQEFLVLRGERRQFMR